MRPPPFRPRPLARAATADAHRVRVFVPIRSAHHARLASLRLRFERHLGQALAENDLLDYVLDRSLERIEAWVETSFEAPARGPGP